ncbi:hypothetical protein [Pseudomonas cannabina]|uniref:Uncharacterized protein n=1 Tax=Pseudomonas cannabina pv. alisalensis TaxID=757414 RepID=A0ABS1XI92_PSEC1|nr:hypothetical protein [Pseudomonas cannabina]MBM0141223.1 hypothetical protein [Pseudomonas cannabina pv. alisalensis]
MNNQKMAKILIFSLLTFALHPLATAQEPHQNTLNQVYGSEDVGRVNKSGEAESVEPKYTVLPDKFNIIKDFLVSAADSHYYGFTALRGQKVLIQGHLSGSLQLEIHDGLKWNTIASGQKIVLSSLAPGQDVIARISHNEVKPFEKDSIYGLILGSFPKVTYARLRDQPFGMSRIPPDASTLGPLSAQGISKVVLEIDMADSTGKPLEGGIASCSIDLPASDKSRLGGLVKTDALGKVRTVVDIGRCVGGNDAGIFTEKDRGTHVWRTQYFEGRWTVNSFYAGNTGIHTPYPDRGQVGHICHQNLVSSTP